MVIRLDIAEEHLHEAGFLHAVWEKALRSPIFTLDEIAKGPERRLLAHLDGLVLGGPEVAQKLLLPAICGDDPDLVFAAALALLMGERSVDFEVVKVALEQAKRGTRPAICRALALAPSPDLGRKLAPLALSAPAIRADLLEVLGYLRLDPGLPLDPLFASGEPDQEALGLALARSFPSRLGQGFVEHAFTSPEPSVRAAALETGLVLRQRGVFEAAHQTFEEGGPAAGTAALVIGLTGDGKSIAPLLSALGDPSRAREATFALGFSGQVAAADALIAAMRDEDLAPLAAEALSAIIGVVVEKALARPPKRWDPDAEEDEDEEEEPGPEADLPKPEPEALAAWWEKAKPKLDPGQRWLRGRPWSLDLVMHELQAGPARRRCALALELAAHSGGQAQLAWDALSTRQLADLHAFRNGVTHAAKPLTHPGFVPGWSPRAPAGPVPTAGSSKPIALVAGSSRWTSEALAVTGIGMVSSLGDEVVTSCAAARAGVTRTRGLEGWRVLDPEEGEGTPAIGHAVAGLDGFSGLGRLACLGAAALHDLLGRSAPEPGVRTGLFLVLPSGWMLDAADRISAAGIPPDRDEEEEPAEPEEVEPDPPGGPPEFERAELQRKLLADQLLPRLLDLALLPGGFQQTRLFFSDSPGFAEALSAAREALVGRLLERCVVGGIDSLLDPAQLEALAVLGMLKAPQTPTGLAPGEAAAFVQVELPDQARRRKAQVLCYLDAWSSASEPQDALAAESYLGQALAGAIGSTLDRIGDAGHALRLVIANQNGTDPRAQDWGHALVRLQKRSFPEVASWFPALHFGETGAATGPVSVCMGARAFARGYAPSPDLLAWLWSETGARASFCVRAAERAE